METNTSNIAAKLALQQALWRRLLWEINNDPRPDALKGKFITFYEAAGVEINQIDKLLSSATANDIELPTFGTLNLVESVPTLLLIARLMEIEDGLVAEPTPSQEELDILNGESLGIKSLLQYLYSIGQITEQGIEDLLTSYQDKIELALGLVINGGVEVGNIEEQIVRETPSGSRLLLEHIEGIPNVTIYSIVDSFRFRHNYRTGAEKFASWLSSTYGVALISEELVSIYDRFRFVMGSILVNRTELDFPVDDSFALTQDHVINDRFGNFNNVNFRTNQVPIRWELFLHELSHAFINSAGFGEFVTSPLSADLAVTTELNLAQSMNNAMNALSLERCSGGTGILCEKFGNELGGGSEIVANYVQYAALGEVGVLSYAERFIKAMIMNVLRNTVPSNVMSLIADAVSSSYTTPVSADVFNGTSMSFSSDVTSETLPALIPASTVQIIAKIITDDRFFIAVIRPASQNAYDYGWVSQADFNPLPANISDLPVVVSFNLKESFSVQNGTLMFSQ